MIWDHKVVSSNLTTPTIYGKVSEWFKELVLKTSDALRSTVGSNPTLVASFSVQMHVRVCS